MIFDTWTYLGVRYLAFPQGANWSVVDQTGENYGSWQSVESARSFQRQERMTPVASNARVGFTDCGEYTPQTHQQRLGG